ncbi:ATP-binding protein [Streptomyces sp. NPDC052042]|uniref:ATP-binding protein n=1 Tax=Streptomyces sp. NPDC052042 TaxID=3365683 RepID=UPI0037D7F480
MTAQPDTLPLRHVLTLPTMGAAVRAAREATEQVLAEWGVGPHHPGVGPVLLILSELVTNSVRHAAVLSPTVTVHYAAGPDTFAFGVHDRHPYRPALYGPGTGTAGGLAMVSELTQDLAGTAVIREDRDGGGKCVWVTVPLRGVAVPGRGR